MSDEQGVMGNGKFHAGARGVGKELRPLVLSAFFSYILMVRVFKYKWFAKFAEKAGITDDDLREAVKEIEAGLVEANYGGNVYKKRIARKGAGKSGGYRTILFFKQGDKLFFMYAFPKSQRSDISEKEERYFKDDAKRYFAYTDEKLAILKKAGELVEI
jgi:hypothetical protein